MFWGILDHFVTTRKSMAPCRTGAINAQVRYTKSRWNFLQLTHPIRSIAPKTHILGCFGPFRYCTKVNAKLAELETLTHKFAKQSRVTIFRNERTRSTPVDPKLMFWCVSDRFVTARKLMQNWPNWCHYRTNSLNKVAMEFFATNAPDPLHLTQNLFLGHFRPFCYCTKADAKLAELVPLSHKFAKQSCEGIFRNKHTRSTPFDPKLMFWGVSDHFVTEQKSMHNWPNWCH
jgi:hypothetical protein